jgi:hypothetical protein
MAERGCGACCLSRTQTPGRSGLAVRPHYGGLQVVLLDDGLVERGPKPAGSEGARLLLSRPGRTAPGCEIAARTVRREAAACQQWRAAFRNGPALVGAPSTPLAQIGCFRFAPLIRPHDADRIVRIIARGCLKCRPGPERALLRYDARFVAIAFSISVLPSDQIAPGTRWLSAITLSNAVSIQVQSSSVIR